jgi:hypothetical protein
MARQLKTEDEKTLQEMFQSPDRTSDMDLIEGWAEKRDTTLWMSPELRAWFEKDPTRSASGN